MKQTDNRFHVTCGYCGMIDTYPSLVEAKVRAVSVKGGSHKDCEDITIFDTMAHIGKPELYEADGTPRETRVS